MKRAGTVDVYCNIHPEMIAKVKVLDNVERLRPQVFGATRDDQDR